MTSAYSQGINPPKYSDEDIESIRFRKGHRIKSYLWRNSDTSEYYIEYYNEAGLIVMTAASGFNTTFYEHNSNGMIVKFYELADGDPNIHYTVTYKDSIISQENWDLHMDFKQRIEYDSEGRRIRDLKIYRNSSRIDSTIIVYLDTREIKTEYENGKAVLIVNSKIYPDSTIREFNKISKHDTIHYLTWSNYFDKRGNKIKRKQTFFDRNQSTEYRNEFNQNNELVSSSTWSNETLKFKTDYRRNQDGKLISSTYNEKDYRTITKYYYSPNGFDAMSVESTFKNGTMTNKEEWYEDYEFYE
jgi:hypothetical protein